MKMIHSNSALFCFFLATVTTITMQVNAQMMMEDPMDSMMGMEGGDSTSTTTAMAPETTSSPNPNPYACTIDGDDYACPIYLTFTSTVTQGQGATAETTSKTEYLGAMLTCPLLGDTDYSLEARYEASRQDLCSCTDVAIFDTPPPFTDLEPTRTLMSCDCYYCPPTPTNEGSDMYMHAYSCSEPIITVSASNGMNIVQQECYGIDCQGNCIQDPGFVPSHVVGATNTGGTTTTGTDTTGTETGTETGSETGTGTETGTETGAGSGTETEPNTDSGPDSDFALTRVQYDELMLTIDDLNLAVQTLQTNLVALQAEMDQLREELGHSDGM